MEFGIFDHAHRVVQRQRIDHRPETQALGALRDRRHEDARARGHAERRRVMLGQVVAEEPGGFRLSQELQPILVKLTELAVLPPIDPVEDSELGIRHGPPRSRIVAPDGEVMRVSARGRPDRARGRRRGSVACST